ncbi:MAG: tRNA (adenosine(37)-N6)-dimethylallyltransferase MiaA [Cyanobacteriota bacterium]
MHYNTIVLNPPFPSLIVICGPTATGKSGLALNLAPRLNGAILNADSRQVYREFDIGTAKPSSQERQQVPHYLLDICDPTQTLTVAEYQQQAVALIEAFHKASDRVTECWSDGERRRGAEKTKNEERKTKNGASSLFALRSSLFPHANTPFLVGGTGLYIRAITRGLRIPQVAPQPELRSQLTQLGQPLCYELLKQVDPTAAAKIHPNDQVRTLRSLEVFYVTGRPMSSQQGEQPPAYPILQIGLDCLAPVAKGDPDPLMRRIQQRTAQMVAQGFVDEVAGLVAKYGADLPLLDTLGYREMRQYLAGEISLEEAIALTALHTRQFAKRQRTWFRADPSIHWFDTEDPELVERVWAQIQQFIATLPARV